MLDTIELQPPEEGGGVALASALARRRSVRAYARRELDWKQIGQLLWAAQGLSDRPRGLRTAPSAGATYPLELDAVLPSGVYRYRPTSHVLVQRDTRDVRPALAHAALGQDCVAGAECVFAICAVASRTTSKYGQRGVRYVHMEAGHAAQNLLLTAAALGLAAVPVGAFRDDETAQVLHLASGEAPLYLLPVGWPRSSG